MILWMVVLTLAAIVDWCKQAGAKEVYSAVIVNKIRVREPGVNFEPGFYWIGYRRSICIWIWTRL